MSLNKDCEERVMMEQDLIDAQELRAQYMAESFALMAKTMKKAIASAKAALCSGSASGGLGHAA